MYSTRFLASQYDYSPDQIGAVWADGAPLPSTTILKNFFEWYYRSSKGRITENGFLSYDSLVHVSHNLFAVLLRETGSEATKSVRADILAYIETLGAEKVNYDKPIADLLVVKRLQKRHWTSALHSRTQGLIGFSLAIKMLTFTDCRMGAICKDPDYPESGIKYEVCCASIFCKLTLTIIRK
jgi:hypothetical protein